MDPDIPQYCRRCGTLLVDGACPTCPVPASDPARHAPKPDPAAPTPTAAGHDVSPATAARHAPPTPAAHRRWFSSVPTPPVASRGKGWRYAHMWNWGAFLLCPLWLMSHGRIGRAIVFVAFCAIPFLWVIALGMAIAYGIHGNRVASMSRDFVDDAQFAAVQNAWRNYGFGVVLLALLLVFMTGFLNVTPAPSGRS